MATVLCPGCFEIRDFADMDWTASIASGHRFLCSSCREIVCPHGKPVNHFCGACHQMRLTGTPKRGAMRADWPRP